MDKPQQSLKNPQAPDNGDEALSGLLSSIQHRLVRDDHGPQAVPSADETLATSDTGFLAPVPAVGMLRVEGEDAITFLQGQLTNNIELLKDGDSQWSGLCNPKGRLMATFLVCRHGDGFWLQLHRDLAAPIAKRLSMYVLRAKVSVTDVSGQWLALGLMANNPQGIRGIEWPRPMTVTGDEPFAVGMPDTRVAGKPVARCLLMVAATQVEQAWSGLHEQLAQRPSSWWRATDIVSGIPQVSPPIQEAFVPQMVNFELVGGVNFEKGCYTGQEVVARSQYLGKMKRRMFLASSAGTPAPGADVIDGDENKIGTVVASGPGAAVGVDAQSVMLFESRVDNSGSLQVSGTAIAPLDLPYEIPEPTPFVRPV